MAPQDGLVSPAYVVARAFPETNAAYFVYLFRTAGYMREVDIFSRGIVPDRNRLYWESFKQIPSVFPPPDEQKLIVRFLDWHGAQTGKLLRAKRKLLALLNEQKQAIIHRAVTRGLDPNVELNPSGLPWLGDVPVGWGVTRLRNISARVTSGSRGWARYAADSRNISARVTSGSRGWSRYAADSGPLFIRIANLSRNSLYLRFHDTVRLALPSSELGEATRTRVNSGDLLLSITAFIGSVAVAPDNIGDAYVSQHVACCRLVADVNSRWVGYVLLSPIGQTHGALAMYGGTKQGLSLGDVKNYVVLLPPREAQDQIVDWIDRSTDRLSRQIGLVETEISAIREFRTRLIADVVTGKLDVRATAASLPEAIESAIDDEPDDADLEEGEDAPEDEEAAA